MFKTFLTCVVIIISCSGCDTAAKQQQAEQARIAAEAAKLKQIGEAMHNKTSAELTADDASNDSP